MVLHVYAGMVNGGEAKVIHRQNSADATCGGGTIARDSIRNLLGHLPSRRCLW